MGAGALTPDDFRHFVVRSLQGFLEDWSVHRSDDPEVFGEALPALDWWALFSEFAAAEIVNPPDAAKAAAEVQAADSRKVTRVSR